MKVLILGGSGMLGHRLFDYFKDRHETRTTLRKSPEHYERFERFSTDNAVFDIDVRDFDRVAAVIDDYQPEVVVNCTGITNKGHVSQDSIVNLEVNSLFPHHLSRFCEKQQCKVVHLSTDCVFSGKKGGYCEEDLGDAESLYGRTKLLGEIGGAYSVTIRTSMIGIELQNKHGLIEWFLDQENTVKGYQKAIFSGFTTHELSRIIEKILLTDQVPPSPLHVASTPISKYDLLSLVKQALGLNIEIVPDIVFSCDRSLDASLFYRLYDYRPPAWKAMIRELCEQIKRDRL